MRGNHSDTSGETAQLHHMSSCLTYTDYLGANSSEETQLFFLIKGTFFAEILRVAGLERGRWEMFYALCPGCSIFVCIADNKGEDYACARRETRARERKKGDLFSWIARAHLQSGGDHFICAQRLGDVRGLFSHLLELFFTHPGNFPPQRTQS